MEEKGSYRTGEVNLLCTREAAPRKQGRLEKIVQSLLRMKTLFDTHCKIAFKRWENMAGGSGGGDVLCCVVLCCVRLLLSRQIFSSLQFD
jgi:hypothetical protein